MNQYRVDKRRGEPVMNFPLIRGADKPRESTGACKNSRKKVRRGGKMVAKCTNYNTTLGNELCMTCWDKEVERRGNNAEERGWGASNNGFKKLPD